MEETKTVSPVIPKFSIKAASKKYFWFILIFFIVAITSGVLLADHESKSTANWKTYTSKEAGVTFKYPESYKIVEDDGWRITIYTNPANTEDNIKIVYMPDDGKNSIDLQFLAACQPSKVNTVNASGTQIKVYDDNACGAQNIETAIIVLAENSMLYDVTLFGKTDKMRLYPFLSSFKFGNAAIPVLSTTPTVTRPGQDLVCGTIDGLVCPTGYSCKLDGDFPDAGGTCYLDTKTKPTISPKEDSGVMCTMEAKECPDGSFVGRSGPKCEFKCP